MEPQLSTVRHPPELWTLVKEKSEIVSVVSVHPEIDDGFAAVLVRHHTGYFAGSIQVTETPEPHQIWEIMQLPSDGKGGFETKVPVAKKLS